jgi:uncharacterized PurR-regulated membrane protein YhhQ (DUF165 family)
VSQLIDTDRGLDRVRCTSAARSRSSTGAPCRSNTVIDIILTSYLVKVTVAVLVTPVIYALHELLEKVWHLHPLPADVAAGDL